YTAQYRVVSLDGHPVEGTVAFGVGATAVPSAATDGAPAVPALPPAVGVTHGAVQALAVVLAGLAAFLVLIGRPAGSRRGTGATAAWVTGILLAVSLVELGLFAVRASGEPLSLSLLAQAVATTRTGQVWAGRAAATVLSGAALWQVGRSTGVWRWLALLPGALLLLTLTLTSHANASGDWRMIAADWVHLAALAPWVGGVAGFALWAPAGPARAAWLSATVPRFSRLAIGSVLLVGVTGLVGALPRVPTVAALWTTGYGRALSAKLLLLVPVLALAWLHLRNRGNGCFRLTVRAELAILAAVFVAAGFLSSLPPASVELAARQGPFEQSALAGNLQVGLKMAPNRVGFNQPTITLTGKDGQPQTKAAVSLRITMPDHAMGLQTLDAREQAPGVYTTEPAVLGMPGPWQVEVVLLTQQGQEVRQRFTVPVPEPVGP
ncbi:MAG TPA: FixH family protein, partial [Symbiobacteriaceae bacterium]|nr:FixH family protein [Symbiobacteriaceae bacterium]